MNNLERYGAAMDWGDLAHYYNERATVSLFAAACWQSGLIALEEFVSPKKCVEGTYTGRADLWAYCPITQVGIAIEAKQMWPEIKTRASTVQNWLGEANEAAAANGYTEMLAGLTFLIPSLTPSESRDDVMALFRRMHDAALDSEIDALAWWLPEKVMEHNSDCRHTGERRMWPGVMVVLRVVKIQGRRNPIPKKERLRETSWSMAAVPA